MRDPRLVEIDFLAELERITAAGAAFEYFIFGSLNAGQKICGGPKHSCFGADRNDFREMVIDLINRRLVIGRAIRTPNATINDQTLEFDARRLANEFANGHVQSVIISHAGRVHLRDRRDALLRDPELEPFGILRNRVSWDRALAVLSCFATPAEPLAVILLDLDDFGIINKTLGMPVGDATLRASFTVMRNVVGPDGIVYRYGGEEVGVLLPKTTAPRAAQIAEQLRTTLENEVRRQVSALAGPQTASIGVKVFTMPEENDVIVGQVDTAVRAAKAAGKNRVHVAQ